MSTEEHFALLSKHFSWSEFLHEGIAIADVIYSPYQLVASLEIVRAFLGDRPIKITSGFRTPEHNKRVGGAPDSMHLKFLAADIQVKGLPPHVVYNKLDPWWPGGLGKYKNFTHVDCRYLIRENKARWTSI